MSAAAREARVARSAGVAPVIEVEHVAKAYRPQTQQFSLRQEAVKILRSSLTRPCWLL